MTRNLRLTMAMILVMILVMTGLAAINRNSTSAAGSDPGQPVDPAVLVREDSHRLSTATDGKVTLVEFLDFECEACGAVYPAIEEIRDAYQDQITLVVRYFPLPSHPNAELAARAAQAAANQGRFPEMYATLFEKTPTFFLNGRQLTEIRTQADMIAAIDGALAA